MDAPQYPSPFGVATIAVARCVLDTVVLLLHRRIHLPVDNRGLRLVFADGSAASVFRETVIERPAPRDPCILVVKFRLRAVRGRGHAVFRRESVLNTLLFAGFPGLITKLWLCHDDNGDYRGVYEWDGAESAQAYARALWRVLALVSVRGSIAYHLVPGLRRADLLAPTAHEAAHSDSRDWWRPVAIDQSP